MKKSIMPKAYGSHINICRDLTSKNAIMQAAELGGLTTLLKIKPSGIPYYRVSPEMQLAAYLMHIAMSISLARLATNFCNYSYITDFDAIEQLRNDPDQNHILNIYDAAIANWTKTFEARL